MIDLPHHQCTGCQGCLNVCPKDAISMRPDSYGYLYPEIDIAKCIDCGLCDKVCPVLEPVALSSPLRVEAARASSDDVNRSVASGGLITLAAEYILKHGGVVYGCYQRCFNDIAHVRIDSISDLHKIQGSKYVKSDIRDTFRQALKDLREGLTVLFTGTPCQIAGLKGYLRKTYGNLITIDLICHGVPPMSMLEQEVKSNPKTEGLADEDIRVDFRWKTLSADGSPIKVNFGLKTHIRQADGWTTISELDDVRSPYMRCFQTGISLRENCFKCQYVGRERVGDLTAADFWGLGSAFASPGGMNAETGVSLVLVNTDKGEELFNAVRPVMQTEPHTFEEAAILNPCLTAPFLKPANREKFLELYRLKGLQAATDATDPIRRFELNPAIRFIKRTPGLSHLLKIAFKIRRIILRTKK